MLENYKCIKVLVRMYEGKKKSMMGGWSGVCGLDLYGKEYVPLMGYFEKGI